MSITFMNNAPLGEHLFSTKMIGMDSNPIVHVSKNAFGDRVKPVISSLDCETIQWFK